MFLFHTDVCLSHPSSFLYLKSMKGVSLGEKDKKKDQAWVIKEIFFFL